MGLGMRLAKVYHLYGDGPSPEERYIRQLMARKVSKLSCLANKVLLQVQVDELAKLDVEQLKKCDYIIKVYLQDLFVLQDSNTFYHLILITGRRKKVYPLYRTIRVSGAMSLATLADKVLVPVMGWYEHASLPL